MTKTQKQISRIRKSIELQERIKANLEAMKVADAGRTVELSKQIIAVLNAQLEILTMKQYESCFA